MNDLCIVLTTCASETTASAMARELVDRGLATSVSLTPVRTFYRFDGQTLEEAEIQLQATTQVEAYPEVEAAILRLHTFEFPEVVMLRAAPSSGTARV
jgi:periplasmic divalent cation tolerance protein